MNFSFNFNFNILKLFKNIILFLNLDLYHKLFKKIDLHYHNIYFYF